MVICGDDGLAHRLAVELDAVCGEAVTVVLPSRRDEHGAEIAALHRDPHSPIELLVSAHPDEQTLRAAGVQRAAALALTYGDDQVNMTAALLARGLNPSVRLVIRMFNRERGRHLERLLDRAAGEVTGGGDDDPRPDMSTTVLSDADTAVPELVAAATVGHGHTLQIEGKVFRGVVRPAGSASRSTDLATLAVLSGAHEDDPASEDSAETPGEDGTQLLPDTRTAYHRQFTHGRLMFEEVTHHHAPKPAARERRGSVGGWLRARLAHLPWRVFLSRDVLAVFGALAAIVLALTAATALFADERIAPGASLAGDFVVTTGSDIRGPLELSAVRTGGDAALDAATESEIQITLTGSSRAVTLPLSALLSSAEPTRVVDELSPGTHDVGVRVQLPFESTNTSQLRELPFQLVVTVSDVEAVVGEVNCTSVPGGVDSGGGDSGGGSTGDPTSAGGDPSDLASTGTQLGANVAWAAALLGAGFAAVFAARRRRRTTTND